MNLAVIGARVHSGWAALLAVSGDPASPCVIDRRRIVMVDSAVVGASQPFHFAENLELPDAGQYLANCEASAERLTAVGLRQMVEELGIRGFQVAGCAIVLAAGRPLPALEAILASHALIHTAEGEFFRRVLRQASEGQGIPVTGIRERDLEDRAGLVFQRTAPRVLKSIAGLGRSLGPPWTQDQKSAALAATIALADHCGQTHSKAPPA